MGKIKKNDHAFLAPSASIRWINCPPSARLEEKYDDGKTNIYAIEGIMAHEFAELLFKYKLGEIDILSFEKLTKNRYTKEQEKNAQNYVDYVFKIANSNNIKVEYKINLENYIPEGFGTTDCVLVDNENLHIIDFKYGKYRVDSQYNTQLMIYALGVLDTYKLSNKPKNIILHIYQPRIYNQSIFKLTAKELLDWGDNILKPNAEKAFKGIGNFKKGLWCQFCRAKDYCAIYNISE